MDLFPFEVSELLSPPPPPPPPPPLPTGNDNSPSLFPPLPPPNTTSSGLSQQVLVVSNQNQQYVHGGSFVPNSAPANVLNTPGHISFGQHQQYDHCESTEQCLEDISGLVSLGHQQYDFGDSAALLQNMSGHGNLGQMQMQASITQTMPQDISCRSSTMIPPSQLILPPPPPPSHPPPTSQQLQQPQPQTPLQTDQPKVQSFNTGPPPWLMSKMGPPGLQGPWKNTEQSCMQQDSEKSDDSNELLPKNVDSSDPSINQSEIEGSIESLVLPTRTPETMTYKDTKVDPKEPGLPKELTLMFEAQHCKLCDVMSSSTVQAKLHYSGKPHEKKVRQWLLTWSEETGLPLPKRKKLESQAEVKPEDLYCQLCEISFTSVKHAEQHKMGKPHQKALRFGYRLSKRKAKKFPVPFDPSGRFGIGEAFLKVKKPDNIDNRSQEDISDPVDAECSSTPKTPVISSKFFCDLCQITATSQEHLDSHYAGAKHKKALVNAAKSTIQPENSVIPPPAEPKESILASVIGFSAKGMLSTDLSIYRTPSGHFYCHPCNTTVNSEKTFKEHTESKRHKFKVASSKRSH